MHMTSAMRAYLSDREEHPETSHDTDIRPRPDIAQGVTLGGITVLEEANNALALRLVVACC